MTSAEHTAYDCNTLRVCVSTDFPQGGDGSITVIEFIDEGGSCFDVEVEQPHYHASRFRVIARGDAECRTLVECMRFAVATLERLHE